MYKIDLFKVKDTDFWTTYAYGYTGFIAEFLKLAEDEDKVKHQSTE